MHFILDINFVIVYNKSEFLVRFRAHDAGAAFEPLLPFLGSSLQRGYLVFEFTFNKKNANALEF